MHFLKYVPLVGLLSLGAVADPVARDAPAVPTNVNSIVDTVNNAINNNNISVVVDNLENILQGGSDAVDGIRAANPQFWTDTKSLIHSGADLLSKAENLINSLPSLPKGQGQGQGQGQ